MALQVLGGGGGGGGGGTVSKASIDALGLTPADVGLVVGSYIGPWAPATTYVAEQQVTYNGVVQTAVANFTSGSTFNQANWTQGGLVASNNLNDLASAPASRTSLGLGGAAVANIGTVTGTVAAGNDSRIVAAAALPMPTATLATANGALVAGYINPVSAGSGARTMSLPAASFVGQTLAVVKDGSDQTANTITITGTIDGTSSSSIVIQGASGVTGYSGEGISFVADSTSSWRVVGDRKPLNYLATQFATVAQLAAVPGALPTSGAPSNTGTGAGYTGDIAIDPATLNVWGPKASVSPFWTTPPAWTLADINSVQYINRAPTPGDPSGATSSDSALAYCLAHLPTVTVPGQGTLTVGEIRYGAGSYAHTSTPANLGPGVFVCNQGGRYATFINYNGTGDCFRQYGPTVPTGWPSIVGWGGGIKGIVVDGTSSGAGSTGYHGGDGEDAEIDMVIQNFSGTGDIGFLLDNTLWWTEKYHVRAKLENCTQGAVLRVASGGATTAGPSFGYNDLDFSFFQNANQDGLCVLGGGNLYNCDHLGIRGNFGQGSTNTGAVLRISGTVPAGHPSAGAGSQINATFFSLRAETGGTGTKHQTLNMNIGNGCAMSNNTGTMNFSPTSGNGFSTANFNAANNPTQFTFFGTILGDSNLQPGTPFGTAGGAFTRSVFAQAAGTTQTLKFLYSDAFVVPALTGATTMAFSVPSTGLAFQEKTVEISCGATAYAVTWPSSGTPTTSSPTVKWLGGTAPTFAANSTNIVSLKTFDGATFFAKADLAYA